MTLLLFSAGADVSMVQCSVTLDHQHVVASTTVDFPATGAMCVAHIVDSTYSENRDLTWVLVDGDPTDGPVLTHQEGATGGYRITSLKDNLEQHGGNFWIDHEGVTAYAVDAEVGNKVAFLQARRHTVTIYKLSNGVATRTALIQIDPKIPHLFLKKIAYSRGRVDIPCEYLDLKWLSYYENGDSLEGIPARSGAAINCKVQLEIDTPVIRCSVEIHRVNAVSCKVTLYQPIVYCQVVFGSDYTIQTHTQVENVFGYLTTQASAMLGQDREISCSVEFFKDTAALCTVDLQESSLAGATKVTLLQNNDTLYVKTSVDLQDVVEDYSWTSCTAFGDYLLFNIYEGPYSNVNVNDGTFDLYMVKRSTWEVVWVKSALDTPYTDAATNHTSWWIGMPPECDYDYFLPVETETYVYQHDVCDLFFYRAFDSKPRILFSAAGRPEPLGIVGLGYCDIRSSIILDYDFNWEDCRFVNEEHGHCFSGSADSYYYSLLPYVKNGELFLEGFAKNFVTDVQGNTINGSRGPSDASWAISKLWVDSPNKLTLTKDTWPSVHAVGCICTLYEEKYYILAGAKVVLGGDPSPVQCSCAVLIDQKNKVGSTVVLGEDRNISCVALLDADRAVICGCSLIDSSFSQVELLLSADEYLQVNGNISNLLPDHRAGFDTAFPDTYIGDITYWNKNVGYGLCNDPVTNDLMLFAQDVVTLKVLVYYKLRHTTANVSLYSAGLRGHMFYISGEDIVSVLLSGGADRLYSGQDIFGGAGYTPMSLYSDGKYLLCTVANENKFQTELWMFDAHLNVKKKITLYPMSNAVGSIVVSADRELDLILTGYPGVADTVFLDNNAAGLGLEAYSYSGGLKWRNMEVFGSGVIVKGLLPQPVIIADLSTAVHGPVTDGRCCFLNVDGRMIREVYGVETTPTRRPFLTMGKHILTKFLYDNYLQCHTRLVLDAYDPDNPDYIDPTVSGKVQRI